MKKVTFQQVKCHSCGGNTFRQEILETYFRYIDGKGKVFEYEEDFTHDIDYGIIRCVRCDTDCTNLFDGIEIE